VRHRSLALLAALAVVLGCGDDTPPTSPRGAAPPQLDLSDGSRANGNPDFFFLPPAVKSPTGDPDYQAGQFNGTYRPRVEVCLLNTAGTACEANTPPVATFSGSQITVSQTNEQYQVNWDTRSSTLLLSRFYRVRVLIGGVELGFFDVDPVNRTSIKNEDTGDYIALVDGRTLPIKFRIENGVLADNNEDYVRETVSETDGERIVALPSGDAAVKLPAGWLPDGYSQVDLIIEKVDLGPTESCHTTPLLNSSACYHITTDPEITVDFDEFITVAVCPLFGEDDGAIYDAQVFYKSDVGEPTVEVTPMVSAPFLTCDGDEPPIIIGGAPSLLDGARSRVLAMAGALGRAVLPKPAYAVDLGRGGLVKALSYFSWATPPQVGTYSGYGQSALAGAALPSPITVQVIGAHALEHDFTVGLAGVPVTFYVQTGGGSVVPVGTGVTDVNGFASANWTLGATPGTQTLTATIAGAPGYTETTATVTATALSATATATTIVGTVYDQSGAPIPGANVSATSLTFGGGSTTANASGVYTLNFTAGEFGQSVNVTASAPGFTTSSPVPLTLTGGSITQNYVLAPAVFVP